MNKVDAQRKTDARRLFEARKTSYGGGVSGTLDETDLLLLSQDVSERTIAKRNCKDKKK